MFKLSEIKELVKLIDQTSVQELEIENEGARLHIRKPGKTEVVNVQAAPITHTYSAAPAATQPYTAAGQSEAQPAAAESAAPKAPAPDLHQIVSPMVGTFYSAPSPEAAAFVKAGDRVTEKSVVCILEAMKLMNELEAEVKGEIVEVLVANGQLVEYGQPLFLVKAD
ncbi:acetyl-CoA carboxylase, biotin carboxyl carrier protein [Paenibacillus sp. MY03]|jgi:acetyl-CoA carboxylase biotin carboxyl carrier protein|uniref:Biotin carboxyl carrier protein of acetyl-CoA carboxylase n=1 Tax=Paenibacillus agaridevorans TaxID=171404 RepID=A0A2R5F021_9BACL|nr:MULTISPECIES: acetyl-CoA carboxylase biotin carboxyl carrier protein [Paenibacillus]OUS77461.1 acetyl-CoA carboxylase, biotin carboxyl carrier protein [Paenibacillus sp. MY03]QNK55453.1 acetyl-CoA carboxylase biotin carboxyl carrier protein [Paenibacillus sp. PAMC21692]GBG12127.1 acetyl-CoA carboxylase biotin carboxyl carrier protein subunit [Paenibacillus agaridevorans]